MSLNSIGAILLGGVALPASNISIDFNASGLKMRHDDREFASIQAVTAAAPVITFQTPIKNALDVVGLRVTRFTDLDAYLAAYTNGVHAATATKYTLNSGATAFAVITGFSASQGGIVQASVAVSLLSADGDTNPLLKDSDEAIPAIAEPLLHTLGAVTINASATGGVQSVEGSLSQRWAPLFADGKLYPQIGSYDGGEPMLSVSHADPVAVLGTNFAGLAISGTTSVKFRAIDAATQVPTDTGAITITVADGRFMPRSIAAAVGGIAQLGFDIVGLSDAAQVHPWALS